MSKGGEAIGSTTEKPIGLDDIGKKIAEAKAIKEPQKRGRKPACSNSANFAEIDRSGTSNQNVLRRLARDAPEMLDKIEAGQLTVNAAAIQAGIRKKPKPEEVCVKAFRKTENRLEAIKMILGELKEHERAALLHILIEESQR